MFGQDNPQTDRYIRDHTGNIQTLQGVKTVSKKDLDQGKYALEAEFVNGDQNVRLFETEDMGLIDPATDAIHNVLIGDRNTVNFNDPNWVNED